MGERRGRGRSIAVWLLSARRRGGRGGGGGEAGSGGGGEGPVVVQYEIIVSTARW